MTKKSIEEQLDALKKELHDLSHVVEVLDDCYCAAAFSPERQANVTAAALRIAKALDEADVGGDYWKDLQLLETYAFNPFTNGYKI